jgi:hypothetical protein
MRFKSGASQWENYNCDQNIFELVLHHWWLDGWKEAIYGLMHKIVLFFHSSLLFSNDVVKRQCVMIFPLLIGYIWTQYVCVFHQWNVAYKCTPIFIINTPIWNWRVIRPLAHLLRSWWSMRHQTKESFISSSSRHESEESPIDRILSQISKLDKWKHQDKMEKGGGGGGGKDSLFPNKST